MNSVNNFFKHQLGIKRWSRHDCVLNRYIVDKENDFICIYGNDSDRYAFDMETPLFACKFSQTGGYEHLLGLANEAGCLVLVDTDCKDFTRSGSVAHNNAIFDIAWVPYSLKLVTASGDHTAAVVDFSQGDFRIVTEFIGHQRSLKTVACCDDNPTIFATGGRDSFIHIWDVRSDSIVRLIREPRQSIPYSHTFDSPLYGKKPKVRHVSAADSVTGLVFQDGNTFISCGAGDGCIKVWDLRKTHYAHNRSSVPKYILPYAGKTEKNGFSHLVIDYHRNILYANCLDSVIYAYNIGTYNPTPIMQYYGHKNRTYYVKMCLREDGQYILSGSSDNNAYIWDRDKSTPVVRLVGHEAEVTSVGWNSRNNILVTCSDDLRHKFWTISERELSDKEKISEYAGYADCVVNIGAEVDGRQGVEGSDCCCLEFKDKCECHLQCADQPENATSSETDNRNLPTDSNTGKRPLSDADISLPSTSNSSPTATSTHIEKKVRTDVINTFLSDLPNFTADGNAPHLNNSPLKLPEQDWLTKLRLELRTSCVRQLSQPSSPSRSQPTSPRPVSGNKPNESPSNSALLKYFKVINSNSPRKTCTKSPSVAPSTPPSSSK